MVSGISKFSEFLNTRKSSRNFAISKYFASRPKFSIRAGISEIQKFENLTLNIQKTLQKNGKKWDIVGE